MFHYVLSGDTVETIGNCTLTAEYSFTGHRVMIVCAVVDCRECW